MDPLDDPFALAERELGTQFRKHTVVRRYLAVVPGYLAPRTIRSTLVPDRGDGRRGRGGARRHRSMPNDGQCRTTLLDACTQ